MDPGLGATQAFDRARRVGRDHAMVGVEMQWYVAALCDFHLDVLEALGDRAGRAGGALQTIISRRVSHDLQGTLLGYRDVVAGHARAMMRVSRVVTEADTIADLARGVLEALTGLEGVVAGFFGRPDPEGRFQFEIGTGEGVEAFVAGPAGQIGAPITTLSGESSGQGPTGRAWRTRAIELSDAYLLDPTTAPWHEIGRRFNWHASTAVPLVDGYGDPRAILNLYAAWAGYFSHPDRLALIAQVKQMMEPALARHLPRRADDQRGDGRNAAPAPTGVRGRGPPAPPGLRSEAREPPREGGERLALSAALGRDAVEVNSLHHQAVDRFADDLEAVAWAPDGVVEAVEGTGDAFLVGVQWHAEGLIDRREERMLLSAFVDSCAVRRAQGVDAPAR